MLKTILTICLVLVIAVAGISQVINAATPGIKTGAERMEVYLPLIANKKVGVFANQTSIVGTSHLVDTLVSRGVKVVSIFSPEHGFRGTADAGEKIGNTVDEKTKIPIISLYGTKRRPNAAELAAIDVLIFDMQDVGLRYYTYISSLEEIMNACVEAATPLLILDRPNPNGFYVDGPVLEEGFRSFVGMQKIPTVHGMTIGEYALMLGGEKWLSAKANANMNVFVKTQPTADTPFHVQVIKCEGYTHKSYYPLPVKPSPNLPNMQSILLYSSTCFFEGTQFSLGRGTSLPFQVYGHPSLPETLYSFTPKPTPGAMDPPLKNQKCYGYNLSEEKIDITNPNWQRIQLSYLMNAYKLFVDKDKFFLRPAKSNPKDSDYFFNKLAGNYKLMTQIMNGVSEDEIRRSWQPGLEAFKKVRKKYLLYPDFE